MKFKPLVDGYVTVVYKLEANKSIDENPIKMMWTAVEPQLIHLGPSSEKKRRKQKCK